MGIGIYVIDSVSKLIIDGMKLSLLRIERMVFQSSASALSVASSSKQMDSSASFTMAGGLAMDRTSDNCFFLIPLTAIDWKAMNIQLGTLRAVIQTNPFKIATKLILDVTKLSDKRK